MNQPISIRYETYRVPITINGPCPICHEPFRDGDLITQTPLPIHRWCDPVANLLDNQISRAMAAIAAQLDAELGQ